MGITLSVILSIVILYIKILIFLGKKLLQGLKFIYYKVLNLLQYLFLLLLSKVSLLTSLAEKEEIK